MIDFNRTVFTIKESYHGRIINGLLTLEYTMQIRGDSPEAIEEVKEYIKAEFRDHVYGDIGLAKQRLIDAVLRACAPGTDLSGIQNAIHEFEKALET